MAVFSSFVLLKKLVLPLLFFKSFINLVSSSRPQPSPINNRLIQASSLRDSCVSELLSKSIAALTVAGLATTSLPSRVRAGDVSQTLRPDSTQALAELSSVEVAAAFIKTHCTVMLNAARTTGRVLYRGEPIFLSQGGSNGQRQPGNGGRRSSAPNQNNVINRNTNRNSTSNGDDSNDGGDNPAGTYSNEDITSAFAAMMDQHPLLLYAPPDLLDASTYGSPLAADFFDTISLALEAKASGTPLV